MENSPNPHATWLRYAVAVPVFIAVTLAGLWLFAGQIAPAGFNWSIAFGALWFVIAWLVLRIAGKKLGGLRRVAQLTLAGTGIVVLALFAWTTLRDVTVNEEIAVGPAVSEVDNPNARATVDALGNWTGGDVAAPDDTGQSVASAAEANEVEAAAVSDTPISGNIELGAGEFETQAHSSSGRAAIVQLEDGSRVLTFENLDTDNGPDLRVYLVDGPAESDDLGESIDLGGLKGNKGNQQYEIPDDVDVSRFTTVSIWCRAFSVGFAKADLTVS